MRAYFSVVLADVQTCTRRICRQCRATIFQSKKADQDQVILWITKEQPVTDFKTVLCNELLKRKNCCWKLQFAYRRLFWWKTYSINYWKAWYLAWTFIETSAVQKVLKICGFDLIKSGIIESLIIDRSQLLQLCKMFAEQLPSRVDDKLKISEKKSSVLQSYLCWAGN